MDPATALAPPPGWTPPQGGTDIPPTIAAQLPTQTTPPVTVSTTSPDQVSTVNPPDSTATIPQQPYNTTPASQDPEMVAGSAHQNWLGRLLSDANQEMSKFLGGDQTIHVTKHQDGSYSVTHEASTTGERWARIAQAVLGGAASGMAAGQGPGGPAKAAAAGIAQGLNQTPQMLQMANQEASQMNQQQLQKANMALLNQKVTMGTLAMRQQGIAMTDADVARANNNADYLLANKANQRLGEITDMSELPAFTAKNSDLIKQHANGEIHTQTELGADGKPHVGVYLVDQNWMQQKNDKPYTYTRLAPGKTLDDPMTLETVTVPPGAHTNGELMATHESEDAKIADYKIKLAGVENKANKADTNPLALQLDINRETNPVKKKQMQDALDADQQRRVKIAQESRPAQPGMMPPGAGAAASAGTTGEDYLKAAVDPSMWNQVRSIAHGDMKMPTTGMKGANQALRNAVMNYDPTYTDARYTTKQNFKTGPDSTKLQQLSTALEHLERAKANADYNPLLPFSQKATDYQEDIKHFTQESGNYIKGGVLTQGEYEDLMKGATSNIPYVRANALGEKADLLGGKVRATFQKYRAGAGNDIPVQEFFDPDSQARLQRYNLMRGGAAAPPAEGGEAGGGAGTGGGAPPPPPPPGNVTVQIPGLKPGNIPRTALEKFKHDHPNAKVF